MNKKNKIAAGLAVSVLVSALLLWLALIVAVPRLIESEAVKEKLRSVISADLGDEFKYDRIGLSFYPAPRVEFHGVTYRLPGRIISSADSIAAYPALLPLFIGKISIKNAIIHNGDVSVMIPHKSDTSAPSISWALIKERGQDLIEALLVFPEFLIPHLKSEIYDSRIQLIYGDEKIISLYDLSIDLTYQSHRVAMQMAGSSSVAKTLAISGWLNTAPLQGDIQVNLDQLEPQAINHWVLRDSDVKIQEGFERLALDLKITDPANLALGVQLKAPQLKITRKNQTLDLHCDAFKGQLNVDRQMATAAVTEAIFNQPQARLSGYLEWAWDDAKSLVQIQGEQIDIESARRTALLLADDNELVRDIFDILKGGRIPAIAFGSEGRGIGDLGKIGNIVIQGDLQNGQVSVPGIHYHLTETSGTVVITEGILHSENLQTRLKNSTAHNGRLKLGLNGDLKPLQVEFDYQLDISQLPSLLNKRVVNDSKFQQERQLFSELTGTAQGHLALSKEAQRLKVRVDANDVHLNTRYQRIPLPIDITGGQITYADDNISFTKLTGSLGKTSFAEISGALNWRKGIMIDITTGKARILLKEMIPWLSSYKSLQPFLNYYAGGKSIVTLSNIELKGPLRQLAKCDFNLSGTLEDIVLKNIPYAPSKEIIGSATFQIDPQTLKFNDINVHLLDATLMGSSTHTNLKQGINSDFRMTLKGSLGPDFMRWFSRALSLPDEVKLRPLNFSKSRIHWIQKGQKTLSASLALETGLELTTTVSLSDDGFNIKKLSIQDRASKAEAALTYKPQLIDLTYNGHLAHSTLDQLIVENSLLNGWIEGHIHTRIDTRNNFKLTLEGQMEGQKVRLPVNSPSPVWLNAFSLRGDPSNIIVESVDVAWNGSQIRVSGKFSPRIHHQLWMDAEINADAIDIDPLLSAARKQKQAAAKIDTTASPLSQVRGSLRFKADRFTVHGFTWSPLQLNIQLREDAAHITSQEAVICGIATPGTVTLSPQAAQFDIQPSANGQKLSATLNCLLGDQIKAEGTYSLKAHLQGEGRTQKVWQTAHGHIEYLSQQGRIYRDVLVSNTLDHVHAQKQLKGQKPSLQMDKQGLSYNSAWTKAKLQQGELVIEEMVLVTDSLDIVGQGKFNPKNKHVDMELLVAPVKTLNRALGYVPVIGGILQSLDVVAVGIKGPYDKIQTTPLAPSAVGYQLKTLLKNTLKAPMNIVPKSRTDRSKTIDTP